MGSAKEMAGVEERCEGKGKPGETEVRRQTAVTTQHFTQHKSIQS